MKVAGMMKVAGLKVGTLIGWKVEKLGDVCEVFADGDWIESKDQSPEGVRLIQTGNVGNGVFKDRGEKARYISEATFKRLRCTEIFEGDCLVSRLPDPVGRACILPDTGEKMITAVDCTIIRFDKKKVIPEFFNYYSQSDQYLNDVDRETSGTTRKRISRSKLAEVEIPIPPLPEQQRIVSVLDETFASIAQAKANAERNLVNARELFESAQRELFEGVGNKKSELKLLGDVATFRNGINFTKASKGEKVKIVGVKDFQNYFWVPLDNLDSVTIDGKLNETDYLRKGDILAVRSNGNQQLIGRSILAGDITEKTTHSGFTIRIRFESKDIFPEYLCHYLKSQKARKQLISGGAGISIKSLNQTTLSELPISLPPLAEQRAIVGRLEALSAETKRLEGIYQSKVDALEELRRVLLARAFEGEL